LAKVLCLDGNFDKARDIYEYALQKLPADHTGRNVSLECKVGRGTREITTDMPHSRVNCKHQKSENQRKKDILPTLHSSVIQSFFPATNHFQVLEQLLKKLQDRLAGGNRRDPFTILPLEIAETLHNLLEGKATKREFCDLKWQDRKWIASVSSC
jgi:hypothetical protein